MDDTKKLIEKYKRELMELSRRSAKPAAEPVPVVEDKPERAAAEPAPEERKPKIIGYVSEESGEFPAVYDRFIAEIVDGDESSESEEIVEYDEESAETIPDEAPEEDIVETSDVLFTPPRFTEIPSTERVRGEITEQSVPENNRPEEDVSGVTDNSATAPRPDFADVQSVSPERAETLADQPISGTAEGEQLTGRSFEDESYPQNPENPPDSILRQGSGAEPIKYPEPVYGSFEEFEQSNAGRGTMLFRVYTAREAMPIADARCVISKKIGGETHEICSLVTDGSGQTSAETLPAPSKELSQSFENTVQPFALYDAEVTREGFADVVLSDIPVFDGVQSIQRVAMVPVPSEGGAAGADTVNIMEVENAR
ncbi:MAG: hypothetical protein NC299_13055 [Lachnospiraceae bacterium]|nr:hypothetical protein [Ruminococcus sp.]MCM1275599.1 hypothetical protein [Lachnospiraceae bacterium]MCM1276266.1 hypothetical protein [Lachnospiraceae bacterium]